MGPSMDFVMSLGLVILLFVGGGSIIQNSSAAVTLGTFVAFQRYIQKMVWPMSALGMAINYYQRSASSSKRLKEIFSLSTDVPVSHCSSLPQKTEGRIEFKNLNFAFPGSSRLILKDFNLVIEPGERIALVGSVGSGKSALLSLLPRIYPIQNGMLWMDGIDINSWPIEELRNQVGYVSQDVFLFSESVLENIAFGLYDRSNPSQTIRLIQEVSQIAAVHDEMKGLAMGYQTGLGERGTSLSGGQKQRLTIARALIKRPSVLVLDDALSSVDIRTEEKILQSLKQRPGRNTEVMAAHRISTVQDADRIVVMHQGQMIQVGTHAQLVKNRNGAYWKFYEQQQFKEELESYAHELNPSH